MCTIFFIIARASLQSKANGFPLQKKTKHKSHSFLNEDFLIHVCLLIRPLVKPAIIHQEHHKQE